MFIAPSQIPKTKIKIAQRMPAERFPSPHTRGWKQWRPTIEAVEVFTNDDRIEHDAPIVQHQRGNFCRADWCALNRDLDFSSPPRYAHAQFVFRCLFLLRKSSPCEQRANAAANAVSRRRLHGRRRAILGEAAQDVCKAILSAGLQWVIKTFAVRIDAAVAIGRQAHKSTLGERPQKTRASERARSAFGYRA